MVVGVVITRHWLGLCSTIKQSATAPTSGSAQPLRMPITPQHPLVVSGSVGCLVRVNKRCSVPIFLKTYSLQPKHLTENSRYC